jgi:NAD-dependent dihydropyrimidine dehydrogenase PreA subunit
MALRELVRIDEDRCDGCGLCVPACAEGAIQIIDGKARLVSEIYCDGLGACLGHCPQEAITVDKVEARAFDERAVQQHLAALKPTAAQSAPAPEPPPRGHEERPMAHGGGCPGSRMMQFDAPGAAAAPVDDTAPRPSQLRQWPVQLHLVSPMAPYFQGADVLLTADCVPFAMADFHRTYLRGKALAVACPKLDGDQEVYFDKVVAMIEQARINSLHVVIMQVPCCGGLLRLAQDAVARATRKVPIKCTVVGVQGEVLDESWV